MGVGLGSVMLARLASDVLERIAAGTIVLYVALRLAKPHWRLPLAAANRLSVPVGTVAGVMQGASGLSAPVSITFLNALRPTREEFIATIWIFFVAISAVQFVTQWMLGLTDPLRLVAAVPIALAMPLGSRLTRHVSPESFSRATLALLSPIAFRLVASDLL